MFNVDKQELEKKLHEISAEAFNEFLQNKKEGGFIKNPITGLFITAICAEIQSKMCEKIVEEVMKYEY